MPARFFNPSGRLLGAVVLLGCLTLAALGGKPQHEPSAPRTGKGVRLAVLVVFDQLRGDYLERWQEQFTDGGFRRLQNEGCWFTNCNYPYAYTVTACGHASLVTGTSPERHGIVGNDWYDRRGGAAVASVETDRYQLVPAEATGGLVTAGKKRALGASPERLLVPNLADALKQATGGRGKVVALSLKARSAVLPGGKRPNACYWFDDDSGNFVTSTYYRATPHAWVASFNRNHAADGWYDQEWIAPTSLPDGRRFGRPDYLGLAGDQDDADRNFRHRLVGKTPGLNKAYYEALATSPFGNDLLLDLARRAVQAEELGKDDVPDLLCISCSSNDMIGHKWGPDSQEVFDVTLRSDRFLRDLFAYLDRHVGKDRYVLGVSADHGVCPLPEDVRGRPAGRVSPQLFFQGAEAFLRERFGGKGRWLEGSVARDAYPWIYLNRDQIRRRGLSAAEVEEALAGWLARQPGVLAAYTRTRLLDGLPKEDAVGQRGLRRSFYPDRCGDVAVVLKPYFLPALPLGKGTTHGTPHPYDTHVPLLFVGPGIPAGVRSEAVTPQAAAAVLARGLGIAAPTGAEAPVPNALAEWHPPEAGPDATTGGN